MAVALSVAVAAHAALLIGVDSPFAPLKATPYPMLEVTLATPQPAAARHPAPPVGAPTAAAVRLPLADAGTSPAEPRPVGPDIAVTPPDAAVHRQAEAPAPAASTPRATLPGAYAGWVRDVAKLGAATPTRGGPRVRRVDAALPQTSEDAYYLAAWRREVERVGNLNYPEAARARKLYGSLRLLVAIAADGSLRDVRVLESSGHAVLDAAALNIVRLAAPYAPLPPAMRRDADVLEIVRTWQFQKRRGGLFDAV